MKSNVIIVFFLAISLLAGCSTAPIKPYQPASPTISERTAQESGVEVALDPFVENRLTKEYFDIDAVADGIAILHVRVSNKTSDQTFLVEKKNLQLRQNRGAGATADGQRIERSQEGGTTVELVGAVLGGLGGSGLYLAGLASVSESTEIQRNFTNKEMADATLSPGKSMDGFIYFAPVKKGEDWSRTATVKITLTETATQKLITLTVPLSR